MLGECYGRWHWKYDGLGERYGVVMGGGLGLGRIFLLGGRTQGGDMGIDFKKHLRTKAAH